MLIQDVVAVVMMAATRAVSGLFLSSYSADAVTEVASEALAVAAAVVAVDVTSKHTTNNLNVTNKSVSHSQWEALFYGIAL